MPEKQPIITIILPVRNEARYIQRCLDSVMAQDYPLDRIEIIVSDGLSEDGTQEIVRGYQQEHKNLNMIENHGKIVSTGLNVALRRAKGEIILRIDGHAVVSPRYVSNCVRHILQDGVDGVGGPMATIGETFVAQPIALAMSSPFGVGDSAFRTVINQTRLVDTVPFPAYTRQIIERAGFYDEELVRNQDDEYNYRIRELGGKILLANDVRSTYFSRASFKGLWRQYYQYGFWKVRVLQKHPRQMSLRQFVPPAFVLSLIVSAFLVLFPFTRLLFPVVFLTYLAVNLLVSLFTVSKRGCALLPYLPLVFAILHISYGLGFLVGLVKFWNRWGDKQGRVPT